MDTEQHAAEQKAESADRVMKELDKALQAQASQLDKSQLTHACFRED